MTETAKESKLAVTGEQLGEQLILAVREMKAGLRSRVHPPKNPRGLRSAQTHPSRPSPSGSGAA